MPQSSDIDDPSALIARLQAMQRGEAPVADEFDEALARLLDGDDFSEDAPDTASAADGEKSDADGEKSDAQSDAGPETPDAAGDPDDAEGDTDEDGHDRPEGDRPSDLVARDVLHIGEDPGIHPQIQPDHPTRSAA